MPIRYEKPKGARIKRYGIGVEVQDMWYEEKTRRWVSKYDSLKVPFTNIVRCHTVRAFRRMLRKHPNIRGKARWVNRYVGYDAFG